MRQAFILFILAFIMIACSGNKKLPGNSEAQEYKSKTDTLISLGNDTIALFYGVNQNKITVKARLLKSVIFDKALSINDFISDAPYKDQSYFDKMFLTGYESDTKEIVFTTYLKRTDKPIFNMEATFTLDLEGNFNLVIE